MDFNSIYIEETDSTNEYLKTLIARDNAISEFTTVRAGFQTAGKGQRGNSWESARGQNLMCSVYLKPSFLLAGEQFELLRVVALAIRDCVGEFCDDIAVKWPNDIYYRDKKLCGVLIENTIDAGRLAEAVVGVGLNVNQDVFFSDAPNPVSLRNITARTYDVDDVLCRFIGHLRKWYAVLKQHRYNEIGDAYHQSLYLLGTPARFVDKDGEFEGVIEGVESCGQLIIHVAGGQRRKYLFKEVAFCTSHPRFVPKTERMDRR